MDLDFGTLSVVTVFVTALLGVLLVFAGLQNSNIRAPMWWGAAQIVGAIGLGLATSRGAVPTFVSSDIANALLLLAYGLTWAGARIFDGRKVLPLVVVFAPVVWLFACHIPVFEHDINLRVVIVSGMMAMLVAATAEEFWRGRDEPLMSRWPTVIVLLAYAAVLLARIPATYFSPHLDDGSPLTGATFTLIAFGTLLFSVVMSFLLLNMTKERTELQHKINALVDPLSGIANRRAFLDGASQLCAQQAQQHEPLAMLLFDLDRFKEINDRLGHAVGDRVLKAFARTTTATLGADVLFGRIGGEEFAALLPVGDLGRGLCHRRPRAPELRRDRGALYQRRSRSDRERRRCALRGSRSPTWIRCSRSPTARSTAPRRTGEIAWRRRRRAMSSIRRLPRRRRRSFL